MVDILLSLTSSYWPIGVLHFKRVTIRFAAWLWLLRNYAENFGEFFQLQFFNDYVTLCMDSKITHFIGQLLPVMSLSLSKSWGKQQAMCCNGNICDAVLNNVMHCDAMGIFKAQLHFMGIQRTSIVVNDANQTAIVKSIDAAETLYSGCNTILPAGVHFTKISPLDSSMRSKVNQDWTTKTKFHFQLTTWFAKLF